MRRAAAPLAELLELVEPEPERAPTDDSPDGLRVLVAPGGATEAPSSMPPSLRLATISSVVEDLAEDPSEVSRFNEAVDSGVGTGRLPMFRRAAEPSSLRRAAASAEASNPATEKAPTDDLLDGPLARLL